MENGKKKLVFGGDYMTNNYNQDGSIYYIQNRNKWRCVYKIFDPNTSQFVVKTKQFRSEQDAKDFFATLQYQKGNSLYIRHNGIPVIELIKSILERKLDTGVIAERTYARTKETITAMEKCDLLKKNIDDISTDELQMYLNSLRHYSQNTIKKYIDQLNQAFKYAQNKGYIIQNPMFDIIRPKSIKKKKEVRALEIEEQQMLTDYLLNVPIQDEPNKNIFLLQMFMGLRVGEALALQTSDINLHKNIITISKTLTTDKNRKVINTVESYVIDDIDDKGVNDLDTILPTTAQYVAGEREDTRAMKGWFTVNDPELILTNAMTDGKAFTVSARVYLPASVLSTGTGSWDGTDKHNMIASLGDSSFGLRITTGSSGGTTAVQTFVGDGRSWYQINTAQLGEEFVDQWHDIAVTYEGSTLILYVDGVAVAQREDAGNVVNSGVPFGVGWDPTKSLRTSELTLESVTVYGEATLSY